MTNDHDGSSIDLEKQLVRYMAERRITRRQLLERMAAVGATVALAPVIAACSSSATAAPSSRRRASPGSVPPASTGRRVGHRPVTTEAAPATPVPTPEKELFVYNWADYVGPTIVKDFEDKYGIKITYDEFPDSDTMLAKIRSDGKGGGYDVSYPTSVDVPSLVKDGVVGALDLGLISNAKNLGAEWANPGYDPGNAHSMPYMWWTTGYAWNPDKIKDDLTSWTALWDEAYKGHINMLDDDRECFAVGAFRLGLSPNTVADADLDQIVGLLQQQKPLVRTYNTDDIGQLTGGQAWITHAWSGDYFQMLADKPKTKYVVPSEGRRPRVGHDGRAVGRAASGRGQPVDRLQPRRPGQRRELERHRLHGPERRGPGVHRSGDPQQSRRQPGHGGPGQADRTPRHRHGPGQVHRALERAQGLSAAA